MAPRIISTERQLTEIELAMAHMTEGPGARFGQLTEQDEFVHREVEDPHYSVTETYWFSFSVPEENLHGQIYLWMHPNLKITSAGCWMWRGPTRHYLEADHFNFRNYLPYPTITDTEVQVPEAGLTVRIVEPLEVVEVDYEDASSDTKVSFRATALIPPVARSTSKHFDQPMHLVGEIVLNGQRMALDCKSMRDKSWGEPRPEIGNLEHPPVCWGVGVSEDGKTAFNFSGVDDPAKAGGEWTDVFTLPAEKHFKEGWIYRNGELRKLVSMSKATERDPGNLDRIMSIVADVVDEKGDHHIIKGTMLGCVQWSGWSNIGVHWNRMRWELEGGAISYGDALEMTWAPHIKHVQGVKPKS